MDQRDPGGGDQSAEDVAKNCKNPDKKHSRLSKSSFCQDQRPGQWHQRAYRQGS